MKLSDVTPEIRAEVDQYRWHPRRPARHPENGDLWFNDHKVCAVCGGDADVTDHDHDSGLVRARLCYGCNGEEWRRQSSPMWALYRRTAPLLEQHEYYYPEGDSRHPHQFAAELPLGGRPGARERVRVPGSFAEGASPCAPAAAPAPGDARLVAQLSRGRSSARPARRTGRGVRDVSPRIPDATTPRGAA